MLSNRITTDWACESEEGYISWLSNRIITDWGLSCEGEEDTLACFQIGLPLTGLVRVRRIH